MAIYVGLFCRWSTTNGCVLLTASTLMEMIAYQPVIASSVNQFKGHVLMFTLTQILMAMATLALLPSCVMVRFVLPK